MTKWNVNNNINGDWWQYVFGAVLTALPHNGSENGDIKTF